MPRSSSSSRSSRSPSRSSQSFSSRPSYSYSSPKTPITMPVGVVPSKPIPTSTPTPYSSPSLTSQNQQVERPGFFSNMWTGFGLGAGQSIAMNIFRSDPVVKHVHDTPPTTSTLSTTGQSTISIEASLPKEFIQCMKDNNNDKDLCKQFL